MKPLENEEDFHDHRDLQLQIPITPSASGRQQLSGIPELASRRGEQVGIYKAYEALRKRHPKAATYLLRHFHMDKHGTYNP